MAKFESVLDRVEARALSQVQAAEILGMSDRSFRRYRDRYAEEGLSGLLDRRLSKASAKGLPCALYTDRGGHYFHTPTAGAKVDKTRPTQIGRAPAQLGIEPIAAYSPEAA